MEVVLIISKLIELLNSYLANAEIGMCDSNNQNSLSRNILVTEADDMQPTPTGDVDINGCDYCLYVGDGDAEDKVSGV